MRRAFARRLRVAHGPGVAVVLLALGLAAPAPAAGEESLVATGSLTYTWHGDPARGCAADGLCGIRGALILEEQGGADAMSFGRASSITIFPAPTTIRVRNLAGGECVDLPPNGGLANLFIAAKAGGGLTARVDPPPSSGRCAGPLARDLSGLRLPVTKTGGKRPSFDLRGSEAFVSGPFSGTLVSTLVFRPNANGGSQSVTSSGTSSGPLRHKVLVEQVTLRYHVASLPGTLDVSFAGEPDPFCAALDACGSTGTLSLSPAPVQGTLTLSASRRVSRPVSARQAVADFRAGRLGTPFGAISGRLGASVVSETYAGGDGLRCQASSRSAVRDALFVGGRGTGGGVRATLNEPPSAEVLRTYCPGPGDFDVLGSMGVLARGSISLPDLLGRHSTVSLSRPGTFNSLGYVGSRSGAVGLSLTLAHVRAGTVQERRP